MIKVGITGGIGSGKTMVCSVFESFGIPVYYADTRARELMTENDHLKSELIQYFGDRIFENNQLNRTKLAQIIFNNSDALNYINSIVHPAVGNDFGSWVQLQEGSKYVIKEAALLFESGAYKHLDILITITCPEELRIERVMKRDGISRDQVLSRIRNQWSEEKKVQLSDFIVRNDGLHSIIEQANDIHDKISKK
jgi:dephospho-CoA kinase